MITWVTIAIFVFVIFSNRSISRRLRVLEVELRSQKKAGIQARSPEPASVNVENTKPKGEYIYTSGSLTPGVSETVTPQTDSGPNKFTTWLKEDWLMKLGAFLFIVGFGWFVSYAFANNWIGPIGRISIGILAGVSIMSLGFWRMMKYPSQGAVFMALGAGTAILTIFAGGSLYGFFTPVSTVAFDFIFIAFVSFAGYKFNVKSLAFIAQVLAFVAPLLTAGDTEPVFLFSYLLFVSLATLFLASITGWRDLIVASLVFVGLYSLPYFTVAGFSRSVYSLNAPIILNFAYLFSMMYLLSGMVAVVKKGIQDYKQEIFLAVGNGLFLFVWIYTVATEEWGSLLFASWAVVFATSSFIAFKFSSKLAPFYAYGSVAVAFIAAATAAELSGPALTIAFIIEVFLLVVSVLMLTNNTKTAIATSWLFIVPVMLSISSMSKYASSKELFTEDFFVLMLMALVLVFLGRIIVHISKRNQDETSSDFAAAMLAIGTFYIGYTLWFFLHILISFDPDMATMTALVLFTIFGLVAYFSGLYGNDMARKTYGIALLSFVVVRLMVIDVWRMELSGRVIAFLAIGVLLMSTAFLTKKKKHEVEPDNYQTE